MTIPLVLVDLAHERQAELSRRAARDADRDVARRAALARRRALTASPTRPTHLGGTR